MPEIEECATCNISAKCRKATENTAMQQYFNADKAIHKRF